jgi:hypothetical protein
MRFNDLESLSDYKSKLLKLPPIMRTLWVCGGPGCLAAGALKVFTALKASKEKLNLACNIQYRAEITG